MPDENDKFFDLGESPKRLEARGAEEETFFPILNVDADKFPPLKDMKIDDMGAAVIKFKINKGFGVEVLSIKKVSLEEVREKEQEKKDKGKEKFEMNVFDQEVQGENSSGGL